MSEDRPMDLNENMRMHMIYTHDRTLEDLAGRSYDNLKAEHDTMDCPATRAKDPR
jgi:hypothetical protein